MNTGSRVERKKYERHQKQQKKRKGGGPSRWIKRILVTGLILLIIALAGGFGLFAYYAADAPNLTEQDLIGQVSSKIYDRQGTLIKELGSENRDPLTQEEIPQVLEDAVIAIEDGRFYQHKGIDPIRIVGSALANLRAQDIVQGGSTITQQLVKLSVFSTDFQDQTLERKAQEAWLAIQLEQDLSKQEILTLYLNKLFYSNNTYGAKTAAKNFFGKEIEDINLAEAALLAGIPQAPSDYDPYTYPEAAQERRDLVLKVMLDRGMISQAAYQEAVAIPVSSMLQPLKDGTLTTRDLAIDAYLDMVAREVQDKMNLNIYTDGVEVYTNMNLSAQEYLYDLVNSSDKVPFPDDQVQTAVSVVDVNTGELHAVIGGRKQEVAMGLNRANTLNRSVGSTMKPLSAYGPAFEYNNYSTGTKVVDEPATYSNGDELFNYDFEYKGNMTIREALASSRNIPAVKVLQDVGLDNAYAFLQKLNINIRNNNERVLVESNAIGGEATPVQMSAAYAAIANYGVYNPPFTVARVITQAGTIQDFKDFYQPSQAMKDSTAYMLIDILKGVPGEFASAADIEGLHHAGKTGTTNYTQDQLAQLGLDNSVYAAPDGWFVGFSPQFSIATWVGYDNPLEAGNYLSLEETRLPQYIYHEMMSFMMEDVPITDWTRPTNLVEVEIEKYSDPIMLPGERTPTEMRSKELFIKGTEPKEVSKAYGVQLPLPTGFDANYNQEQKVIEVRWDPATIPGQFELSLNGQIVYTGTATEFKIPASETGEYVIGLRYYDGPSSSASAIITLTLSQAESSEDINDLLMGDESLEESSQALPGGQVLPDGQVLPGELGTDEYGNPIQPPALNNLPNPSDPPGLDQSIDPNAGGGW